MGAGNSAQCAISLRKLKPIDADRDGHPDRRDFVAQKLALLDEVTRKAAESNQLNAVIGATRLSAELAQLV